MIAPLRQNPSAGAEATGLAVDHLGVVVRDLDREVAAWRGHGFRVSDPAPLMSHDANGVPVPLGQRSAHIVFENGYVELSSPIVGSGNHLEPYLRAGEGVRILVLATRDAAASHALVSARWPNTTAIGSAERRVMIDGAAHTARFRWFPLPVDIVPGVLSAVVQHLTPQLVFHPSFVDHGNGLCRLDSVLARGARDALVAPSGFEVAGTDVPRVCWIPSTDRPAITAMTLATAGGEVRAFAV